MHASHLRNRDRRTFGETPGISRISMATTAILATKSVSILMEHSLIRLFICSHRKKFIYEWLSYLVGQAVEPPRPIIHPEIVENYLLTSHFLHFDYTFYDKISSYSCIPLSRKVLPTFPDTTFRLYMRMYERFCSHN